MPATLIQIVQAIRPGQGFTCFGDDYATLQSPDGHEIPTLEEIEAARDTVEASVAAAKLTAEKLAALPGLLMAEFAKLSASHQARWYSNGVRSGLKDAFADRNFTVARAIIAGATTEDETEATAKTAMLALFTNAGIE